MLQDVSTTATLPIRNYDSIKRHIFSIRSTLCAVSRREPSILPTDLVSSRNRFKASMIYAVSTQRITIRNVIHFYLSVIENTFTMSDFLLPNESRANISRDVISTTQCHDVTLLFIRKEDSSYTNTNVRRIRLKLGQFISISKRKLEKKRKQMKRIIMRWISSGRSMWIL